MDFSDTPEEANFRAEVRAWLDANGAALQSTVPDELYIEADIERCRQWQRKKADAGYAHIVWPREYGAWGAPGCRRLSLTKKNGACRGLSITFLLVLGNACHPL